MNREQLFTFARQSGSDIVVTRVMKFELWSKYNENRNRQAFNPSNNETYEEFCARRYDEYVQIKTGKASPS